MSVREENGKRRFASVPPRGISKDEAAEYCGCETKAAFDTWVHKGIVPGPIPGTNRWDRKAIDFALDRASNLATEADKRNPLEEWLAAQAGRRSK
jgi:hypothetical protein